MSHPNGEEKYWSFPKAHSCTKQRPYKVPNDCEMVGRVGDSGKPALTTRHPLSVYLELETDERKHEDVPKELWQVCNYERWDS